MIKKKFLSKIYRALLLSSIISVSLIILFISFNYKYRCELRKLKELREIGIAYVSEKYLSDTITYQHWGNVSDYKSKILNKEEVEIDAYDIALKDSFLILSFRPYYGSWERITPEYFLVIINKINDSLVPMGEVTFPKMIYDFKRDSIISYTYYDSIFHYYYRHHDYISNIVPLDISKSLIDSLNSYGATFKSCD